MHLWFTHLLQEAVEHPVLDWTAVTIALISLAGVIVTALSKASKKTIADLKIQMGKLEDENERLREINRNLRRYIHKLKQALLEYGIPIPPDIED